MPITQYRPTTPARRGMTTQDLSEITTRKPLKSLVKSKKQNAGRNNTGRITVRHRGGGVKRHYRLLDHKLAPGLTVTVEEIEYDPNQISFRNLLTVFFATHDPTIENRQGNDVGTQYRSILLSYSIHFCLLILTGD